MQRKLIQVQGEFCRRSQSVFDDDWVLSEAVNVRFVMHIMQYVSLVPLPRIGLEMQTYSYAVYLV